MKGKLLGIICASVFVMACAGGPGITGSATDAYVARQAAAAEQAYADGDVAGALAMWRTLLPVAPDNSQALEAIARLQAEIEQRSARAFRRGEAAYRLGDFRSGDRWMLEVLALAPGHAQARARLQDSVSRAAHVQQAEKSKSEYAEDPIAEPLPDASGTIAETVRSLYAAGEFRKLVALENDPELEMNDDMAQLFRASYAALAEEAGRRKRYDAQLSHLNSAIEVYRISDDPLIKTRSQLRARLSDKWYREGLALMTSDLNGAVAALEKSLAYDANNLAAKQKLRQAKTLARNLERIKES